MSLLENSFLTGILRQAFDARVTLGLPLYGSEVPYGQKLAKKFKSRNRKNAKGPIGEQPTVEGPPVKAP